MARKGSKGQFNLQNAARMRVQQTSMPINTAPTDKKGDNYAYATLIAFLIVAIAVLGGGLYWSATEIIQAVAVSPVNWIGFLVGAVCFVLTLLAARALAWMSLFVSVLIGTRMNGWKSVETICSKGLPVTRSVKIFPGGSVWLATAVTQSLLGRGQYDRALQQADSEWNYSGSNPGQAQNMGTLCFAASVADQAKGDVKTALVWNERSLKVLNSMMEQLQNPKKGFMAKVASVQYEKVEGQLRSQLAGAYFNNATLLFNKMEHRKAKESYKLAVEHAAKAPDFPEKADIIKFGNEQLGRLKHT